MVVEFQQEWSFTKGLPCIVDRTTNINKKSTFLQYTIFSDLSGCENDCLHLIPAEKPGVELEGKKKAVFSVQCEVCCVHCRVCSVLCSMRSEEHVL